MDFDDVTLKKNFNSHAHVERDYDDENIARINLISTHTLTWSVTGTAAIVTQIQVNFNSHAHVERDCNLGSAKGLSEISTHTLTWSVT